MYFRHSAKGFPTIPDCGHRVEGGVEGRKKNFECFRLNMQDVRRFHQAFYKTSNKIEQDHFIVRYAKGKPPKRHRLQQENSSERGMAIDYFIPSYRIEGGSELVKVCQKCFVDILKISKFRIQRLCRNELMTGMSPGERRGGDTRSKHSEPKLLEVKKFIESLQTVESHYCRGKSKRQYLPSHLSIQHLCDAYNNKVDNEELKVKYEYFRKVFVENYNVGFGSPATDQCSKCLELKERIKSTLNEEERSTLKTELAIHKKRGETFFSLLQDEGENELTYSFDCQKNLIFPKLTDQSAYFLRQFYVSNFTMCLGTSHSNQTPENTFIYGWTEMEAVKGSSEIATCIVHRLSNTVFPENIDTIRLFADGAGGQNKNSIVITALLNWLITKAPVQIKTIVLHYPVPGHSYIPPDRVFGVIERKVRKLETIVHPDEYFTIFKESASVIRLGTDIEVHDWKEATTRNVKKPADWHFKFSACKRFILTRGNRNSGKVQGEITYLTDLGTAKGIAKRGCKIDRIIAPTKPDNVVVNPKKVADVKKLLKKHYGEDWASLESLKFYVDLFNKEPIQGPENQCNEDEEEPMDDEMLILEGDFVV